MHAHAIRGAAHITTTPRNHRSEVSAALAALWPLLLSASSLADGPDPAAASGPLKSAGELLLAAARRLAD